MDYPILLSAQLKQHLKSLRKSRRLTQTELARRLGVVQSRVADIEANPGAISVEQLLQLLAILNAQLLVRDASASSGTSPSNLREAGAKLQGGAKTTASASATLTNASVPSIPPPDAERDTEPKGQW